MTDNIGARLRQAREERGLSLGDAARSTKLPTSVLRAIEENDFASLPAGMYRKAYLRTLAAEVGLDPLEIAADYETQYEAPVESATEATETATVPGRWVERLPSSQRRTIVTLTALAILSVAWFALQPSPVPVFSRLDVRSPTESRVQPTPVHAQRTAAAPVVQTGGTRVATATTSAEIPLKIALTTTGWCWVAAESDGERVVRGLLEPGRRVLIEGQRRILLRLGDAGSVQLSINDGPSRTAGADGEVVDLEVTPDVVETFNDGAVDTESKLVAQTGLLE